MTKPDPTSRASRALTLPIENIRWRDDAPRPRRWKTGAALAGIAVIAGAVAADAEPRLAAPGCIKVEVQPGGNVWSIAQQAGVSLDVIAELNPQVRNLSLVHPGDEIAVNCPGLDNIPADPTLPAPIIVQSVNEMPKAEIIDPKAVTRGEPWEGMVPWPGFNEWLPGDGVDGVASQAAVLKALYRHGARGDMLVNLAAVTEGESNRRIAAEGDQSLADKTWGHSYGVWQVRSMLSQDHTGGPRDRFALKDNLDHQAWAAVEVYNAAVAAGKNPMNAWYNTWVVKKNAAAFIGPYRELAQRMGLA